MLAYIPYMDPMGHGFMIPIMESWRQGLLKAWHQERDPTGT